MAQNLYVILGVAPDAEPQQITRAFRRLIRTLHPDAAPEPQLADGQNTRERFEQVLAAYRVLHDPAARAGYDRTLNAAPPRVGPAAGPAWHDPRPGGQAPLVAGPTVIQARTPPAPPPALRVGPPVRLGD